MDTSMARWPDGLKPRCEFYPLRGFSRSKLIPIRKILLDKRQINATVQSGLDREPLQRGSTELTLTLSMIPAAAATSGDEHQLVAAARAGDDRAFEALYSRYAGRIVAY